MNRRSWVRLDNASNVFLAARSEVDPKVFRISAELDHEVDPDVLQMALDTTYDHYPLYRAVLRRGIFWYYLQDSELRPRVVAESQHTCAPIYQADRRTLLFRVVHHRRRIVLEVFHALSDGTGALWFLTDLVSAYVRLRSPGQQLITTEQIGVASVTPFDPGQLAGRRPDPEAGIAETAENPAQYLSDDSFAQYFRLTRRQRRDERNAEPFLEAPPAPTPPEPRGFGRIVGASTSRVHRVRGTRTPDNRPRAVELTLPAEEALTLARAAGVSLTVYLTALFFDSIRRSAGDLGAERTLSASIPVNLRQFFPSTSARNFFATVRVEHTYGDDPEDLDAVCRSLDRQFRPQVTSEALQRRLRRFVRFERALALRVVPRPLKDLLLGLVNRASNRGLTVAVSNLGRVALPETVNAHVERMLFHVSAVRPQFCAISHAGRLVVTFTSPFTETGYIREFARRLSENGVEVSVAAARVTEPELADEPSPEASR
ncbi:alcohol acetyltransferase [Leucobacter tardus]|uniref:Alcohol acetyltransferase n=1 Tax=Leucobacter tardus TaxID=501483 RepID=A0A939QAX0_9MICO|nr:alcohol acetyltransferase [Leucobacter tardus]MBO2988865.1 alcohol acetyltransferase [Leucobacter tardus]